MYSLKLPLAKDSINGLKMNVTIKETIKQNFKMLVLTSPGERVMDPYFGVGFHELLFEQNRATLPGILRERLYKQTQKYMPYVEVTSAEIFGEPGSNILQAKIGYAISSTGEEDFLLINSGV